MKMAEVGDQGKQVQLLKLTVRKAIEDTVNNLPDEEFVGLFAAAPKIKKKTLLNLFPILKSKIINEVVDNILDMIEENEIDQKLKEREQLIETQSQYEGTTAWRPTGSVSDDIRAHDMAALLSRKQQFNTMCENVEREVEALRDKVIFLRNQDSESQEKLAIARERFEWLKERINSQLEEHRKLVNSLIT